MSEQNREKEERLFRALSGVEEELLHRSEQNEGVEKRKANGKYADFRYTMCPALRQPVFASWWRECCT